MHREVVVVTGASSGIGYETAKVRLLRSHRISVGTRLHQTPHRYWAHLDTVSSAQRGAWKYTIKPLWLQPPRVHMHAATWAKFLDKFLKSQKLGGLVAEIEAAGGTAAACHLDVTDEATYETLFSAFSMTVVLYFHGFTRTFPPSFCAEFAEARFGGVDHVFLNAGQKGVMKGPADMAGPEGAWNPA